MRADGSLILLALAAAASIACGPRPPDQKRIRADLAGRKITLSQGFFGSSLEWPIAAERLKAFTITKRATDTKGRHRIVCGPRIELDAGKEEIRADLLLSYRRYDQGWLLDSVETVETPTITQKAKSSAK